MSRRGKVLESALTASRIDDEFICTRRTFSRLRERLNDFQKTNPSHIFRNRREGNLVFIWRSR